MAGSRARRTRTADVETFLATLLLFIAVTLAMAVGVVFSGRRLKGSCGGTGRDCSCDEAERAECALAREQRPGS